MGVDRELGDPELKVAVSNCSAEADDVIEGYSRVPNHSYNTIIKSVTNIQCITLI